MTRPWNSWGAGSSRAAEFRVGSMPHLLGEINLKTSIVPAETLILKPLT